ncbi:flocculation protein FLO11-like [Amphibalanus amphitrite]|uniref:flocculation protein FLO11-like n=1 Tax=Amphibalanus amphitrite TaxID=1232801 RepID=UPI001C8FFD5F|nr:flocculation protein FLO11-like [Amphibalanus amphitrite]
MASMAQRAPSEERCVDGRPEDGPTSECGRRPDHGGPVSRKGHPTAGGARSGRNAGGAAMDGSDLDSRTGAARTVADLLERDEKLPAADSSHLALEIGALHAALKRKDLLIASLQSQLLSVCQSRSSREAEREARQRERALLLERSAHLQQQIDRRRAHVKNARLTLEQLDTTERNIDDCIRRAELEYRLETEELNILNIQGEHLRLRARLEGAEDDTGPVLPTASLSSCLPSHAEVSLLCLSVSYDPDSPCFSVTETVAEPGVLVEWASDSCGLSVGDRLIEVNGHSITSGISSSSGSSSSSSSDSSSITTTTSSGGSAVRRLLADCGSPLRLLVVRCRPPSLGRRAGPTAAVAALQQELAQLSGRLQQKTQLNKALRAETQRSIEETAAYRAENQRLLRRVRQLETRVQQMQNILDKIRGVTDESLRPAVLDTEEDGDVRVSAESPPPSRVPDGASDHERSPVITPRDPHLISVTVPAEQTGVSPLSLPTSPSVVSTMSSTTPSLPSSPTTPSFSACPPSLPSSPTALSPPASPGFSGDLSTPRSPSSLPASSPSSSAAVTVGPGTTAGTGTVSRPPRPQPAPRPRSLLQRLQLFGERRLQNAAASLQRPRPPQKPARLSLQRAVSLQALQHETQAEEPHRQARPAVQTWPSMDGNLEMVRQRPRPVRVRHQVCSLPRPGRINAMRSVPI